jgi:hypothetical protein
MDDAIERTFRVMAKKFPSQMNYAATALLNDMAFDFRDTAVSVLGRHYTIRSPQFIKRSFQVQKANRSAPLNKKSSTAASVKLAGRYGKTSTGWEEAYTGHDARDTIWTKGAREGSYRNQISGRFRIPMNGGGFNKANTPSAADLPSGIPSQYMRAALIDRIGRQMLVDKGLKKEQAALKSWLKKGSGAKQHFALPATNNKSDPRFSVTKGSLVHAGAGYNEGLYAFKGGRLPTGGVRVELEPIRLLRAPHSPAAWDWRGEIVKAVKETFSPDFVLSGYIQPAIARAFPNTVRP